MNFIDLAFLIILIAGLLFGLLGKWYKKVFSLGFTILAIFVAYIACPILVNAVNGIEISGKTINVFLTDLLSNSLEKFGDLGSSISGITNGALKLVSFWVLAIVLIIVFNIIGLVIVSVKFKKRNNRFIAEGKNIKRFTAWKTLGLASAAKWLLIASVAFCPILSLSPVIKSASALAGDYIPKEVTEQVDNSKVLNIYDGIFSNTKPNFMVYSIDGKDYYLYDDFKSLQGLVKVASVFTSSDDPLKSFSELTDDEIKEMFTTMQESGLADAALNAISEELKETNPDLVIDLENVNLAEEADTFIAIKNVIDFSNSDDIKVKEELTEDDIDNLTDALAHSEIVKIVAESNEGMLDGVDVETKDNIENKLNEKVSANEISQEDMNTLMKLFNTKQ